MSSSSWKSTNTTLSSRSHTLLMDTAVSVCDCHSLFNIWFDLIWFLLSLLPFLFFCSVQYFSGFLLVYWLLLSFYFTIFYFQYIFAKGITRWIGWHCVQLASGAKYCKNNSIPHAAIFATKTLMIFMSIDTRRNAHTHIQKSSISVADHSMCSCVTVANCEWLSWVV